MKKLVFILCLLGISCSMSLAQKSVYLTLHQKLGSVDFLLNKTGTNNLGNKLNITRVDYYMSGFVIIHDGGKETSFPDKYILVKGNKKINELIGTGEINNIEAIQFGIGVEAPTNNNDPTLWPKTHPLAPQNPSMHWGWVGGYRFVALEGKAGDNLNTLYQMHCLLNENYFKQKINVKAVELNNNLTISLDADYQEALYGIDVTTGPINHGTNLNDLFVLYNFRDRVFKETSRSVAVEDVQINSNDWNINPNPSYEGSIRISNLSNLINSQLEIVDHSGKTVFSKIINSDKIDLDLGLKGIYFVRIQSNKFVSSKKLVLI